MKKLFVCLLPLLIACNDEPRLLNDEPVQAESSYSGAYILSEGLFNQNNSSLAWLDFESGQLDSWQDGTETSTDCFRMANGRRLGDTANDMLLYGSKLYIAVDVSSTVEVVSASDCLSLRQIEMNSGGHSSEPRYLTAWDGKVYVCCYDGSVARIDTTTMQVDASCRVGRNPDGICAAQGKLYVSNSGGLDYDNLDNTISVIDIESFTEISRIVVGANPGSIATDGTSVFVIARGRLDSGTVGIGAQLVRIDAYFDQVAEVTEVGDRQKLAVADGRLWVYGGSSGGVMVLDCLDASTGMSDFIQDSVRPECIYGLAYDETSDCLYLLDAKDYVTPGSLYCYDRDGMLRYRVNSVGINPNTVAFASASVNGKGKASVSGYPDKVLEYLPAPGQFIGLLPRYEDGDDAGSMCTKCLSALLGDGMVSLGGLGGSLCVGFNEPIANVSGEYDFEIDGNAFSGSSEAGVVWVSKDVNGNGLADDGWFEIAGSAYDNSCRTEITYKKPQTLDGDVDWSLSDGQRGTFCHNEYHSQSYWPLWLNVDSLTYAATMLPDNMTQNQGGNWVMGQFGHGYADDCPNGSDGSKFDLDWAVKADGSPAELDEINFIRIVTGVLGWTQTTGELSTEISSIYDLHPQNKE